MGGDLGEGKRGHVTAQHTGTDESCTLTGSPAPIPDNDHAAHRQVLHDRVRQGGAAEAT
ncbi:hypothetical protein [Streptomyces camelliae]|uniref:DUF397 domain-containing protein n=1 Tax=Streptomyces camelliae TaxID=3004093 RepID=A0ABY7NU49_9ACTN|nr:hypothetical protein [Streptomyces sp. HUAS 2-6]WBO61730.1 hypothetical protein O1G22_02090 [Streptomyces sp. HUAS 2-6]